MSPTRSRSEQPFPKMEAAGRVFRMHTSCSRISPPSQPRPQTRTHLCIRKSISAACSAAVRSTGLQRSRLCIPNGRLSWLSGRRHSPAASGSNLLFAPLDRRFLDHSCRRRSRCCTHSRAARVQRACTCHACT